MEDNQRYRAKRVGRPSPYVPEEWRWKYAVETMRSVRASTRDQIIELSLMYYDEKGDGND